MKVLAIPGSLRRGSYNERLLRLAAERAPAGVEVELYEELGEIPPYDEDIDRGIGPGPVTRLRDAVAEADALLFATPEYNSSIPGVLKNAVDWVSRPRAETAFQGKPSAVIGASTGRFGAAWAQAELRKALKSAGARVSEVELAVGQANRALDEGLSEAQAERLDEILAALASDVAVREPPPNTVNVPFGAL